MIKSTVPNWDPYDVQAVDPDLYIIGYKNVSYQRHPLIYPKEDYQILRKGGIRFIPFRGYLYAADHQSPYPLVGYRKIPVRTIHPVTGQAITVVPMCYQDIEFTSYDTLIPPCQDDTKKP